MELALLAYPLRMAIVNEMEMVGVTIKATDCIPSFSYFSSSLAFKESFLELACKFFAGILVCSIYPIR